MKLTKDNAALFLTLMNAGQHYARAARDYFADPTPERKELALRKGALFHGHLRRLAGEPTYVWSMAHADGQTFGHTHQTKLAAEEWLSSLRAKYQDGGFAKTTIVKLRVLP